MTDRPTETAPALAPPDGNGGGTTPTRRAVLQAGGAALALGATGFGKKPVYAQEASPAASPASGDAICVLTPELTEGPYYLDDAMIRQDVAEGKEGVPLALRIVVNDPTTCSPVANAAVEIWHCDALGYYSGVDANNPGGEADEAAVAEAAAGTFLRGVQLSDADGVVEFQTIFPGWYAGRTVHIHMMVHTDGAPEGGTYEGGQVNHIGQLFFDEALTAEIFATAEPYSGRDDEERLRNEEDNILGDHADEPGFLVALTPLTEGDLASGLSGEITVGVDPEATPAPEGGGDGRPSNQGGPEGAPPPGGGPPPAGGPGDPPPGEEEGTPEA